MRVVPVHAGGERKGLGHGDVQLEWEPAARRAGCAEQERLPVRADRRAHHAGGEVQEPGEVRQIELGARAAAVPARTATAASRVAGKSRGSSTRGSAPGYRLKNHGKRARSLTSRSCSTRGSAAGSVHSRPGS